jgi:sulfate transport system substrate-binding protein
VRRGNPRGIKDWPDLLQPGLEIVTPDPRSSGNGKLAALAAWAALVTRGGSEAEARRYLRELYRHAPSLAEGARAAAIDFAEEDHCDVHLTWENEAIREVAKSQGKLEIVYPPVSIRAEPEVAWLDNAAARKSDLAAAKAYLAFFSATPPSKGSPNWAIGHSIRKRQERPGLCSRRSNSCRSPPSPETGAMRTTNSSRKTA